MNRNATIKKLKLKTIIGLKMGIRQLIKVIEDEVVAMYNCDTDSIYGKSQDREHVTIRHTFIYLLDKHLINRASYDTMSRICGTEWHHGIYKRAVYSVENRIKLDTLYEKEIRRLNYLITLTYELHI